MPEGNGGGMGNGGGGGFPMTILGFERSERGIIAGGTPTVTIPEHRDSQDSCGVPPVIISRYFFSK